jgi:hypothetical protein
MNILDTNCPICNMPLMSQSGSQIDLNDGVTIYCNNMECSMTASGHGKNEKEAISVYMQKCSHSQKDIKD